MIIDAYHAWCYLQESLEMIRQTPMVTPPGIYGPFRFERRSDGAMKRIVPSPSRFGGTWGYLPLGYLENGSLLDVLILTHLYILYIYIYRMILPLKTVIHFDSQV